MTPSPSLAGRALLAVVLMIGFYILAVAIAAGLVYIPYAEVTYAHRIHPKLAILCVIGALAILWSVLPRFDKFESPGPQLTRDQHPRLFQEIDGVAKSVNQAMPAEVFLVPDVNAWVTQRGGVMGFGSRRVMGLGLPLMRMLTKSQFRAVLAHEFGHYYGGDTKLGPWIYKTRGAIGRTLESLGDGSVLRLPFLAYGKMFLRITHAISRRQEFVADELAARAIGSQALIGGLRTVHGVAPAFDAYWLNECAPVLNAGFRPPLAEGFRQFVQAGKIADAIGRHLDEELKEGKVNPYDTHPPLKERIAAVQNLPPGEFGHDDPPATTLLADVPALENQLLAALVNPDSAGKLKPIDWEKVGEQVYLPEWGDLVKANTAALSGVTPESLPQVARDIKAFGKRCRDHAGAAPDDENAEGLASGVVGAALSVLLMNRGATADAMPGQPVVVTVGSATIEPFSVLSSLADGKLASADWLRQCNELGIQQADLGKVPTAA